jgi:hypothetical protein
MMFWNKKAPQTPLHSQEYEALSNLIIDLNNKVQLLKGDITGVMFDFEKIKTKLNQRNTKTPPETSEVSGGLPPPLPKGLNSFNPFL